MSCFLGIDFGKSSVRAVALNFGRVTPQRFTASSLARNRSASSTTQLIRRAVAEETFASGRTFLLRLTSTGKSLNGRTSSDENGAYARPVEGFNPMQRATLMQIPSNWGLAMAPILSTKRSRETERI